MAKRFNYLTEPLIKEDAIIINASSEKRIWKSTLQNLLIAYKAQVMMSAVQSAAKKIDVPEIPPLNNNMN